MTLMQTYNYMHYRKKRVAKTVRPKRPKLTAAQWVAAIIEQAANLANSFVGFVNLLHMHGYNLCASDRGVVVTEGDRDWYSTDQRNGLIPRIIARFFWRDADFTPGGLPYKVLAMRLRWIKNSGFTEDQGHFVIDTLADAFRKLDVKAILALTDAAFVAFPTSKAVEAASTQFMPGGELDARRFQYMIAVFEAAGLRLPGYN